MRSMNSYKGKCLHHPFIFHHSAENTCAITAENKEGHLLRIGGVDRWTRRLSYIYYGGVN